MPFFDIHDAKTDRRLLTVEAPTITDAAFRAIQAAPHCDGLGPLRTNICARPHRPPCTVAFFADAWFRWQAELSQLHGH